MDGLTIMSKLIQGVVLFDLDVKEDTRGILVPFELSTNLPFRAQRAFFIKVSSPTVVRGEHASSADQVVTVASGAVTLDFDNGSDRLSVVLAPNGQAVLVQAGVWLRMHSFVSETIILVVASQVLNETRYFQNPQPDLVADR